MPKHNADELHELSLRSTLRNHAITHLRVRRHAQLLVLESGPEDDPIPHARFRRQAVHIWTLELPSHTGRWDKTPYRGLIDNMLAVLETEMPWTLAPI